MGKIEKVGKNLKVKSFAFFVVLSIISVFSCEIGLGAAVDVSVPTSGISYPPQNAVVRETFVAAGICEDDQEVASVKVTVTNTEDNTTYGPYDATLAEDKKSWTVTLNNKDPSKTSSVFDSYRQWEIPDGNYVISAIAYDTAEKESPAATLPISIDNTAPVLIVSKPLAKGSNVAPTIYGSSLKISGDIAEDHETSKMLISLREFDDSTGAFTSGSTVQTIEITDTAELNAMSSSNPLIIAKFDRDNTTSQQHQNYVRLYGDNENGPDKYYYCGFLLEDNALIYQNPADTGSSTGNQTECYYLLADDFQNNLAVNYSLTAQRLMQIFKGQIQDYNVSQINEIATILTKTENYSSSTSISTESSKFSINPHNNPTWSLDEYAVDNGTIKSYTAGSSLILSLTAGRDASYPDPRTVSVYLYDITTSTGDVIDNYSTDGLTPIPLIQKKETDDAGNVIKEAGKLEEIWDESADDSNKTYTFQLDTETCGLQSNHYYKIDVIGMDRNKTDLEALNGNNYVLKLSTSNNIPKVTITEPKDDKTFGVKAAYGNVNTDGVTIKGYVVADGVALNSTNGVIVKELTVTDVSNSSPKATKVDFDCSDITITPDSAANTYNFIIVIKPNSSSANLAGKFVPDTQSKYLYNAKIEATDASDLSGEKNVKFYVDNKLPDVQINTVSPETEAGFVNGNITVKGVASDSGNTGSGLASISYEIREKNAASTYDPAKAGTIPLSESWKFEIKTKELSSIAAEQDYNVIIKAVDVVGNENTFTKEIKIKQSTDTPVLSLSNAEASVTDTAGLGIYPNIKNIFGTTSNNKLFGTITDDDGLGTVELKYQKAGSTQTGSLNPKNALPATSPKSYTFEYKLPSQEGEYTLLFEAKDKYAKAAGNDASKCETAFDTLKSEDSKFYITIDDGAPEFGTLTVTPSPSNSYYMGSKTGDEKTIKVTGSIIDGNGFDSTAALTSNSSNSSLTIGATTGTSNFTKTFEDTITLPSASGKYTVIYTAKDKYGQTSTKEVEYSVDVTKPEIKQVDVGESKNVTTSVSGWINSDNVMVETIVKDQHSGIAEVKYSVDGGNSYSNMTHSGDTTTGEKWSANVTFPDGNTKTLKIKVKDNVGNESDEKTVSLQVDKKKPNLNANWYKVSDNNTDGSFLTRSGKTTAYVNDKDLVIFGNYTDGTDCSGVNDLVFKLNGTTKTPKEITYYKKTFETEDDINTVKTGTGFETTDEKEIKSFIAVIDYNDFADGDLTVEGSDKAGNKIEGESLDLFSLITDNVAPNVSGITITKSYKAEDGTYYIRNTKDGKLTISGNTTDNYSVDKTVLKIIEAGETEPVFNKTSKEISWKFENIDLKELQNGATVKITAYDKAGNEKPLTDISLVFDETKPAMLTGKIENPKWPETGDSIALSEYGFDYDESSISDEYDTSNPYISDYTLRGKPAWKYGGITIGKGSYGDTSYGTESSLQIGVTFVGETGGSGIKTMEYRMLPVSKAASYSNVKTGKYSGTVPTSGTINGEFVVEPGTYKHYKVPDPNPNPQTSYSCLVGTATISGFESTVGGTPNLLFVHAIDNCENESDWFVLLIQVDDETPEIKAASGTPDSLLTNGTKDLQKLSGTFKDGLHGSGLKAARVYVDGKLAIYGNFTQKPYGLGDETGKEKGDKELKSAIDNGLTISAKDASGNAIDLGTNYAKLTDSSIFNKAVEVSFTNDYGVFTYKGFAPTEAQFNTTDPSTGAKKYSFKDAASYATWELTLTPQNGSWFNSLNSNPQISIEVEDWAEDASGSGNKSTLIITSLDIDTEAPTVKITSPVEKASGLNGNQTIKGTVTEEHTPKLVEIYAYVDTAATPAVNPPAKITDWGSPIKTLSTEDGSATVQQLYSFMHETNFNTLLGTGKAKGKVHILVYAEDKAGNANLEKTNVIANQNNGEKAYQTFTVDRNSDRPIVTVTSITLAAEKTEGAGLSPLAADNYFMLDTSTINLKIEDDDGIEEAKYIIKNESGSVIKEEALTLVQNRASIKFTDDGKQTVEFSIKDTGSDTPFASDATDTLQKIYLTDMAATPNKYGDSGVTGYENPVIYVNVDTKTPTLRVKGVQLLATEDQALPTDETGWQTSAYSSTVLGGPAAKFLRVRVEASDEGSGIDTVKLSAKLDGVSVKGLDANGNPVTVTATPVAGETNLYDMVVPCTITGVEKENVKYVVNITVSDKVGKLASESITFKADNKAPQISIKAPSSTENLSGSITAEGEISNKESATLYYSISPFETAPDGADGNYTDNATFRAYKFKTVDKNGVEHESAFPARNKANTANITPASDTPLNKLCGYKEMSEDKMMSFYLYFDGETDSEGIHSQTLNQWILNMGITDSNDLSDTQNPFDDIVHLYLHIKAVDSAGNVNKETKLIKLDPLGQRPKVVIAYPDKDDEKLGGSPTLMGSVTGANQLEYLWLQIDCDEDTKWTVTDINKLFAATNSAGQKAYKIAKITDSENPISAKLDDNTSNSEAAKYAVRVDLGHPTGSGTTNSANWSQQINIGEEFKSGSTTKNTIKVKIWAYATDHSGFTSSQVVRTLSIDQDSPVIDQDILLVQWNDTYNGGNAFEEDTNGNIELDDSDETVGKIQFKDGAIKSSRTYSQDEDIKGKWFVVGKVTDSNGIGKIEYKVTIGEGNNANLISTVTAIDTDKENHEGTGTNAGTYIRKTKGGNYVFCLPIGDETSGAVNTYSVYFFAEEANKGSDAKHVEKTFSVKFDNLAPVVTQKLTTDSMDIVNSDGFYTFGSSASEAAVNGVNQTGVDRIAFYFTRQLGNDSTLTVFDPMMRVHKKTADGSLGAAVTENALVVSTAGLSLDSEDGLYWKSATVSAVTSTEITVDSIPSFVHVGGLAKVNGVIYKIVAKGSSTVILSGSPGSEAVNKPVYFAVANVVDNPTVEGLGKEVVPTDNETENYGYGYYKGGSFDDGDYMVEKLVPDINESTKYNWQANINSKNISDGPVILHYVVFDKAGNVCTKLSDGTTPLTVDCVVKNNAPRLAGVTLSTDMNGNGSVDDEGETVNTYEGQYPKGMDGKTKKNILTVPSNVSASEPKHVFTVKGKTVIKPEIVGGNGTITYKYSVATYKDATDGWNAPSDSITPDSNTLGTGTQETDGTVSLSESAITLDVIDFLKNSIGDGKYQKFSFEISDSTPGITNGQSATLNVYMTVALRDNIKAQNKIIPFYWKSKSLNSIVFDDSTAKGHIELSKDLPTATFNATTGIYDLQPKVSGKIKLEGIAQDNNLLETIKVTIGGNTYSIATYGKNVNNNNNVEWMSGKDNGKWEASVEQATYEDCVKAGYIDDVPTGKKGTDKVPETSQDFGHLVHWTMIIDTAAMGINPQTDLLIKAEAYDKGAPSRAESTNNVTWTSTGFNNNGDGNTPIQTGGKLGDNSGDGDKYTCWYTVDVVPYITKITTWLSSKSKKADKSEYDRTALGHYPVKTGENIKMEGFNLTGGKVYFTKAVAANGTVTYTSTNYNANGFDIPNDAISGKVYITAGTNNITSLNNINNNNSKGDYAVPTGTTLTSYGEKKTYTAFTNFYNRKPNTQNNYTLTDDVEFDIWQFNSNAALPNGGGRIDEVSMKINPKLKLVGFSFLSSFKYFSAPGNGTSYSDKGEIGGQADFRSTASLTYDWRGYAYATDAGGGEGNRVHFWIIDEDGADSGVDFEVIGQNGTREQNHPLKWNNEDSANIDLRYKVRSPSIATSKADDSTTNMYFAYYDSFNDEIRFKAGTTASKGLFAARRRSGYTCSNSQVIATDYSTNHPTDNAYNYTGTPLGGAGEFVAIDVIPKGTVIEGAATGLAKDVVVAVWYDAVAKSLKYAYNTDPLNYSWQTNNTTIDQDYRGLNRQNWYGQGNSTTAQAATIFTGAGEYCQVKVDQKGGVHIAAYDSVYGDLRYAYLPKYNSTYNEDSMSYTVDSSGNTGSHLTLDVAYDKAPNSDGKPVPYISYWGGSMPKIAHPVDTSMSEGTESDMFTGNWEVSYIPTTSTISDLDQKKLNNLDNRINVALWKYDDNGAVTTIQKSTTAPANAGTPDGSSGTCYGNGTSNPVVAYSREYDSANDRIETAQMK